MEDTWKPYTEIDFADLNIQQYHVDTRDFCCITNIKPSDKDITNIDTSKPHERYLFTPEELKTLLDRLFTESGGQKKWRHLSLEGTGAFRTSNWQLKYMRIRRYEDKLIICTTNHFALSKNILDNKVHQLYLSAQN